MPNLTRIYVATSNAGKLRDFAHAAAHADASHNVEILPLPDLRDIPPPCEDKSTFAANARSKALYYAWETAALHPELIGSLVLADDSGLEVDALDHEPGVRSARYAEDHAFTGTPESSTDERNNQFLLRRLADHPGRLRTARYRCALTLVRCGPNPTVVAESEGTLEGEILPRPRGTGGFGYDPLFLVSETGLTMAELSMDQRLDVSHRGRALRQMLRDGVPPAAQS